MGVALSAAAARRVALAAQGFTDPAPSGRVDRRHLRRVLRRVGLLQIDSVNVVARAHLLPVFSRVGPYPVDALAAMAYRNRELYEYWGHEASLLPVACEPLLRWRAERARRGEAWGGLVRLARDHPGVVDRVRAAIRERGPVTAAALEEPLPRGARAGSWWDRGAAKLACEWLLWTGEVTAAERTPGFARRYDLLERVLPAAVLDLPTPDEAEAHRALLRLAAGSLGVATLEDLADYHRLKPTDVRPRVAELVEEGTLVPVEVQGWDRPGYLATGAARPRRVRAAALLAPFDPVVWRRERAERLFAFRYRIEIYTPAERRVHGYYVLPFLLDDALVGRVDLKADRADGVLRARGSYAEPGVDVAEVAATLAGELRRMAQWLGLADVAVEPRGDLAPALRTAVG